MDARSRSQSLRVTCLVLCLAIAGACGRPEPSPQRDTGSVVSNPTAPSPTGGADATRTISGVVTDADTLQPIAGAVLYVNGRHKAITDASGSYSVVAPTSDARYTYASADGYEWDYHLIRSPHNLILTRPRRIRAGESVTVVVNPSDSLCVNNMMDDPGGATSVCRIVRVVASQDGILTLDAQLIEDGTRPVLESEILSRAGQPCCAERLGNPRSVDVKAGDEVLAMPMVPIGTPIRSIRLSTTFVPR
jgi:hypothetical protein